MFSSPFEYVQFAINHQIYYICLFVFFFSFNWTDESNSQSDGKIFGIDTSDELKMTHNQIENSESKPGLGIKSEVLLKFSELLK